MASVRVESIALRDARYGLLGQALGGDRFMGLGIMSHVWEAMTETWSPELGERGYCVSPDKLVAIASGSKRAKLFPDALVTAGLGEPGSGETDGLIRIKGTKGRIEWLYWKRKGAAEGGRRRLATAKRGANGKFTSPAEHQPMAGNKDGEPHQPEHQPYPSVPAPTPTTTTEASPTGEAPSHPDHGREPPTPFPASRGQRRSRSQGNQSPQPSAPTPEKAQEWRFYRQARLMRALRTHAVVTHGLEAPHEAKLRITAYETLLEVEPTAEQIAEDPETWTPEPELVALAYERLSRKRA